MTAGCSLFPRIPQSQNWAAFAAPGGFASNERPGMLQRRIVDVLTDLCDTHPEMPVTPEHVWRVIREQVQPTRGRVMSNPSCQYTRVLLFTIA
jgi:hypothetical protein